MASYKFLHAADLHLGSPFQGLAVKDADIARRFADASRKAFSTLVARAVEEGVGFAVIAGDVYDGDWKDSTIGLFFNREVARLDRAGIPVYFLKGNHDAESVITRSISLPDSVWEFSTRKPTTFRIEALKVALHGQGFAERAATENLALTYPAPVPGWFNIGVLHTSLTGRPPHAGYAPCSPDELRARGYDYWALGHVHEFEIVSREPAIVFPGNLQGRSIRETGAKGAVIVTVEDGRTAAIDRIIVDEARWCDLTLDISGLDDFAAVLAAIEDSLRTPVKEADGRLIALRMRLTGESILRPWLMSNRQDVTDEVQAACHRRHPDIWLEKLDMRVTAPVVRAAAQADLSFDLEALLDGVAADPAFREKAEALVAEVAAKLPSGLGAGEMPLGEGIEALIAEARDTIAQRAGTAG